jgi:PUA domain protein
MSTKIKNRHRLKRKEVREIITEIKKTFSCNLFDEKSSVEIGDIIGIKMIFIDGEPYFMIQGDIIFFTLLGLFKYMPKENFVVVDMGAVKFVTSGADVMSPGIVDADRNIEKGDQVWICDERHHKPLAIGIAIMNGEDMLSEDKGKSVDVIHFVGDKLWNLLLKNI